LRRIILPERSNLFQSHWSNQWLTNFSQTRTYAVDGDWWVVTIEVTDAAGKSFKSSNRYKADGKDYPWKGSDQRVDAISVTLPDDRTRVITTKKAGKVMSRSTATISKDGRTMTVKDTGLLPDGKPTEFTIVFEKQ
jgi:hypothetical protein